MFNNIYRNKKVLVTGDSGFKGSWLILWLKKLGASVIGYSLPPSIKPNHMELLNLDYLKIANDICNRASLEKVIIDEKPEMIFHLAAQSLVRESYLEPEKTYLTNVMGTVNLLESCRIAKHVRAVIVITSDKCYDNKNWIYSYRENDPLGGHDPYSSSKACQEIVTKSYRDSYFSLDTYLKSHNTLIASVRAGNVIGGGDWASYRLMSDVVNAVNKNEPVIIRNPNAIRPWQHVLDCLAGYLLLGQQLLEQKSEFVQAWNFGPQDHKALTVEDIICEMKKYWNKITYTLSEKIMAETDSLLQETNQLHLDCTKASSLLKFKQVWDINKSVKMTADWYQNYYENRVIMSLEHLQEYIENACHQKLQWAT